MIDNEDIEPRINVFFFIHDFNWIISAIEKLIVDKAGYYATGDEVFMVCLFIS